MPKELIINASLPEVRIALMEDGRIQELLIERQSDKGIVGNIYKGRVTRVLPGMQAAFVDVGLDKAAFLYVDDIYVHPKVMGDAEIVDSDDDSEESHESEQPQSRGRGRGRNQNRDHQRADAPPPARMFTAKVKPVEAGADAVEEAEVSEGVEASIDTASFESHAAEHAESDLTEFSDELDQDLDEEDFETNEDEDHDFGEDDELDEDVSGEDSDGDSEEDSEEDSEDESSEAVLGVSADGENAEGSESSAQSSEQSAKFISAESAATGDAEGGAPAPLHGLVQEEGARRGRGRNRRRGRGRSGKGGEKPAPKNQFAAGETFGDDSTDAMPENFVDTMNDKGNVESDRAQMQGEGGMSAVAARPARNRPEFREQRGRDRRIKSKHSKPRAQANIADLLKEGQEVIVQVAKDPIATKGARLTCHVSLPGRHLVCMPTIDHVGVSRRIERDDERRKLRDFVERNRPRKMGFIVRTASGGKDPESWIKQDIDYLSKLWTKIRTRADEVSAPSIVYEDLNSVLRSIRDWVNEDIDKIIVDSRYHYNELMEFADRFMPSLLDKIELYQGDIPIFDAYGLSSELHRSLERRVWLKSGGYIVIDQAEALVAIDVNTGRFVGKKNLEDTILKTNLEACEEIAYQLRLRNCGGIIICDFIDMERDENRMRVYRALDEALKKDRARPTIQKISELGLVEMTRKRTRDTIIRTLCEPCVHCEGKGFGKSVQTVAYEILRECERMGVDREARKILISAHESVVDILAIELRDVLDSIEKRYNKTVYLQSIIDFHAEQFEVVTDRMGNKKASQDIARTLRVERERAERKEKQKQRNHKDKEHHKDSSYDRDDRDSRDSNDELDPITENIPARLESRSVPPTLPTKKAEGAFVVKVSTAVITPVQKNETGEEVSPEGAEEGVSMHAEEGDLGDDDQETRPQPAPVNTAPRIGAAPAVKPKAPRMEGMDDEDQLAYLRAQAAQDAALAYTGASPSAEGGARNQHGRGGGGGRNQQARGGPGGGRNQNNNNRGGRGMSSGGGRNQDRGGGRGRPQQPRLPSSRPSPINPGNGNAGGGGPIIGQGPERNAQQSYSANGEAPSAPQVEYSAPAHVPDYEVLVKPDSDNS